MRLQGILLFLVRVSDHLQQFFCIIYAKIHEKLTFFPSKNIFCPLLWESSFQKVPYSSRNLLYTVSDFNITSKNSVGYILHNIKFIVIKYGQMGYFSQSCKYILPDIDFIFKLLARISHYIYISWVVKSKYGKIYLIYKKISFILCQIYILWFMICLAYLNCIFT